MYTPLEVVSPVPQTSNPGSSTSDPPPSNEEKILVSKTPIGEGAGVCPSIPDDDSSVIVLHQSCEGIEQFVEQLPEVTQPDLHQTQACETTPTTMNTLQEEKSQELLEGIMAAEGSRMLSSPVSRYILDRSHDDEVVSPQYDTVETGAADLVNFSITSNQNLVIDEEMSPLYENPGRINFTRNEILTSTRVLDRIPSTSLQSGGTEWNQPIPIMITEKPVGGQGCTLNVLNSTTAIESGVPLMLYPSTEGSPTVREKDKDPNTH